MIKNDLGNDYDIITISETWLKSIDKFDYLNLENFHDPIRKDRFDNSGYGGPNVSFKKTLF